MNRTRRDKAQVHPRISQRTGTYRQVAEPFLLPAFRLMGGRDLGVGRGSKLQEENVALAPT